jgi:hypothetical protein
LALVEKGRFDDGVLGPIFYDGGVKKRKKKVVRHRSPMPPPGKVMEKIGYQRSREKERVREELRGEGS